MNTIVISCAVICVAADVYAVWTVRRAKKAASMARVVALLQQHRDQR